MRSGLAAALMGIGGILVSFGAVIAVIAFFSRYNGWHVQLPTMTSVTLGSIVIGGVMFVAGYLLSRIGRDSDRSATRTA
jgi:ABC-type transport system involved in multi-copper enzyme maturation permease subunit